MVEFLTSKLSPQARAAGQVSRSQSRQLARAGQVAQQSADTFSKFFEKEAAIENERLLATGQAEWAKQYDERAKTAGHGFTKSISSDYQQYVADVMANAPKRGRENLQLAFDKFGMKLSGRAIKREASVRAAAKAKAVSEAKQQRGVALFHDPSLMMEFIKKDRKNADFYANISNSVRIKNHPELVLAEVKNGDFDNFLSAKQLLATKKAAEQEIARVGREVKTAQAVTLKNFEASAAEEVAYAQANGSPPVDSLITGPEFEAVQRTNPEEAAKLKKAYDIAIQEAETVHGVNTASQNDLKASFDKAQAKVKEPGRSAKDAQHLSSLVTAIKSRNKQIADDSASFVLGNSDEANANFTAYQNADSGSRDIAARNYLAALGQQYDRIGVPSDLRRVLPKTMANSIVENFNGMGADVVTSSLKQFKNEWGDAGPQVIAELSKAGLPMEFVAAMRHSENPGLSASIVGLKGQKEADLTKDLPTIEVSDARKDIIEGLSSYRAAFEIGDTTGAAAKTFSDNSSIARRLVFEEMRKGTEQSTAVEKVLGQMFPEDVVEANNMHLIIPVGIDSGDVQLSLDTATSDKSLRAFDPAPLDDPRLPEFADKEVLIESAISNGIWLNNPTGDGAILHLNIGGYFLPVENKNGGPYEIKFSDAGNITEADRLDKLNLLQ